MGFKDALRYFLPQKRPEERFKIFKEWARANLATEKGRMPTEAELDDALNAWKKRQYPFGNNLKTISDHVFNFSRYYGETRRKERAQKAAKSRWEKSRKLSKKTPPKSRKNKKVDKSKRR